MRRKTRPAGLMLKPATGGNEMSSQEKQTTARASDSQVSPDMTARTGAGEREKVAGTVTWEEMRALMGHEPAVSEKTWRPTTGGLLSILSGSWNLLLGLGALLSGTFFYSLVPTFGGITGGFATTGITAGIILIIIGLISIVGGAYALRRQAWPMALAGSIAALIPTPLLLPFVMGILSLIFNVLGRREFWVNLKGKPA